ncbi:MAG: metal-dependent hydrolase [Aureispira sp.]
MDSITQATLGAAVGHAVLGKKMGNKAVLIGAFAGTVPDLDVISQLFAEHQIYNLVYHRGISHSILFTIAASPIFAWLSLKYYKSGLHHKEGVQVAWTVFWALFYSLFLGILGYGAIYTGSMILYGMLGTALLGIIPIYRVLRKSIQERQQIDYDPSFWRWTIMYALAFLTHWIIDSCTAYGTQIFEPFSNYRVGFNNISIVDPLYTVPMIIGLIGVLLAKKYGTERRWNYMGLILSTAYMGLTIGVKFHVNGIVEANLQEQNITYEDYITYPSIFNAILWQTTVQSKGAYYYSNYSLFDSQPTMEFVELPKNHQILDQYEGNKYLDILKWFSRDYYNITENEDGTMTFNILLFGLLGVPENSTVPIKDRYVFRYILVEKDGQLDVKQDEDVDRLKIDDVAQALWERIKGN